MSLLTPSGVHKWHDFNVFLPLKLETRALSLMFGGLGLSWDLVTDLGLILDCMSSFLT